METKTENKKKPDEHGHLVTYTIKVDGKAISDALEVASIDVQQEINVITKATIVIVDGDPTDDKDEANTVSGKQFLPGKTVEICLGYDENNIPVFSGIIVTNSQKSDNDCVMLTLECKDETVKMTIDKNSRHHTKIKPTQIASDFFDKYGFKNHTTAPCDLTHDQLVQYNSSDWDFMISKLDVANLMCILHNGAIHIKEILAMPPADNPIVKLEYGENIIEFSGDLDARTLSEKVTVLTWNYTTQRVENEDGEAVYNDAPKGMTAAELARGNTATLRTAARQTEAQKLLAKSKKVRELLSKMKGTVKFFGRVEQPVIPGHFINITGTGDNYSGDFFVSAIHHEYSGGDWTTTATLGWDAKFFTQKINPTHDAAASGELSAATGLQSGVVTGIVDQDGDYRVRVRLPMVDNTQDGVYARLTTLDAGGGRGTFFMPEVGDEVIVGFLNNDPSQPIVIGMVHSSAHAAPLTPEEANNKKGIVSRSQVKLLIDDGEKSVTIETPGGNVFSMNDTTMTISLSDMSGNQIIMNPAGITIQAAKVLTLGAGVSLALAAPALSMNASGGALILQGHTAEIKSSSTMTIQGAPVNIN